MQNDWRAAYRLEAARLLQGWADAAVVDGDRLWCWAQWLGAGGAVADNAAAAEVSALCAAIQGDPIGTDGRRVRAVRAVYAWGKAGGDEGVRRIGLAAAKGVCAAVDGPGLGRADLSLWSDVLALCGQVLADEGDRAVHYVAARCVAVLLNDFYQVEREAFLHWADGQDSAELAVQIEAADALLAEAVRCADERLWAWASALVQRLAARVDQDERAAETLRLPAVRIRCRRAEAWTVEWIDRPWCEAGDGVVPARLRSLVASVQLRDEVSLARSGHWQRQSK